MKCWATPRTVAPHSRHRNAPANSSGRTSDVRVTVPAKAVRRPILAVVSARRRSTWGRPVKETQNSRGMSSCGRWDCVFDYLGLDKDGG